MQVMVFIKDALSRKQFAYEISRKIYKTPSPKNPVCIKGKKRKHEEM